MAAKKTAKKKATKPPVKKTTKVSKTAKAKKTTNTKKTKSSLSKLTKQIKKAADKLLKTTSKKPIKKPEIKVELKPTKTVVAKEKVAAKSKTVAKNVATPPKKVATLLVRTGEPEQNFDNEGSFTKADLENFRISLEEHKEKILEKARQVLEAGNIALDKNEMTDEVDLASITTEQNLQFRLFDRDRKLLAEIEHALGKLKNGDFGYCEGTGEAIPKRRLELRPWTRHSVKFKEQLERMKKSGRGVGDEDNEEGFK